MPTYRVPVRFNYSIRGETTVEVNAPTEQTARKLAVEGLWVDNITDRERVVEEMCAEAVDDTRVKQSTRC